jgi:hypothetical protein
MRQDSEMIARGIASKVPSILVLAATWASSAGGQDSLCAIIMRDGMVHRGLPIMRWDYVTVDSAPELFQYAPDQIHRIIAEDGQRRLVAQEVMLRSEPVEQGPEVATIPAGQPVMVLQRTDSTGSDWALVNVWQEATGWIPAASLVASVTLEPLAENALLTWPPAYSARPELVARLGYRLTAAATDITAQQPVLDESPFQMW